MLRTLLAMLVLVLAVPVLADGRGGLLAPALNDLPTPRPALVSPQVGQWPFVSWSYAKAYTYNFFGARFDVLHRVYRDGRWNTHIRSEQVIGRQGAEKVASLVSATKGSFETSKCPFPRHAVVYFDREDKPVAGVDICFECEDLFAWPDFDVGNEEKYGYNENYDKVGPGLWKAFERSLEDYKSFFLSLGQPIDYK